MSTLPEPTAAFTRHSLFADQVGEGLVDGFPFETVLSLAPVIAHWRTMSEREPSAYAERWTELARDLAAAPELFDPIEDPTVLDRHKTLIARLIRPLFPSSDWTRDARALTGPFGGLVVYRTERYERMLGRYAEKAVDAININDVYARTLYAYKAILSQFFGITLRLDHPLIFIVPDEETGLSRYFKLSGSGQFTTIEVCGALPELSPSDVDELLQNVDNLALWQEKIPPHLFRFVGVTDLMITDVTHETAIAAITHLVLTSDASMTEDNFGALEQEVRNLCRTVRLRMGLASLQADGALNARSERRIWNSLIIRDGLRAGHLDWRGTLYEQVLQGDEAIIIRNVSNSHLAEGLRTHLLEKGVQSLFLQPLRYKGRAVGLLELSSPEARAVDASTLLKMQRVAPIFALAVYQNLERFEARVESVIQDTYTAIHPSVQWRFREAAVAMLEQEKRRGSSEPEPVVFEGLYPLYGSADIRGSTRHRNEAIRCDVLQHLDYARETLQAMQSEMPLTILDELSHRIGKRIEQYSAAWHTGDEADATQFLLHEVEPILRSLTTKRDALRPILDAYCEKTGCREALRAQAYESSRYQINRLISAMLLAEQDEAQRLFPHYFEHAKTDGVEHTMYIGQSIAPKQPLDCAYVQNLRLRQLIVSCSIAQQVRHLNASLDIPLDIAQLILVQEAPVTLRFRTDEKKFDVEGASGVRFELLKKRLDKACVKNTKERITQPDQIAVVYASEQEEEEYGRYIEYLAANQYVEPESERLEVEDLPGATGLKMLRLRVRV